MGKADFFSKPSVEEMQHNLAFNTVGKIRGLVEKIIALEADEGIHLTAPIIPLSFLNPNISQAECSRIHYKHGNYLKMDLPSTLQEVIEGQEIPLNTRMRTFEQYSRDVKGRQKRQEEVDILGIQWTPVQGPDRIRRFIPFDALVEGTKINAYARNHTHNIEVNANYIDSQIVSKEGAKIICSVPSRTPKKSRYEIELQHVPVIQNNNSCAIAWSLSPTFIESQPEHTTYVTKLRHAHLEGNKTSDSIFFGPHQIAAYLATVHHFWNGLDKSAPLTYSPVPFISKATARFYDKLEKQIIIFDPTLDKKSNPNRLRHLHLDEKSILLGRLVQVLGAHETMYWHPERDGPIRNYW